MNKQRRKKVYVLGDARGVYRIQNLIKFLVDRPKEYGFIFDNRFSKNRILRYLTSLIFAPFKVLFSNVVYVCILNVDIDILYSMFWARVFRKKIIVDYYVSIYEKVVVDEGWFKEKSFLAKLAKKLDRFYYKSATKALFLSELERDHYCELAEIKRKISKEVIVPLCVEENFKIQRKSSDSTYNVCWWGTYLPLHGLNNIIEMMSYVDPQLPIKLYIFGNDDQKAEPYLELARSLNVDDRCEFHNDFTMKNGKLKEFLIDNCDLALGNFGNSPKARFVITNKVIDACAMKTSVFTGDAKEYFVYFDGENDIFFSVNAPKVMAETLVKIYMSRDKLKDRIEKTYQIYQSNFTQELYYKNLDNVFKSL